MDREQQQQNVSLLVAGGGDEDTISLLGGGDEAAPFVTEKVELGSAGPITDNVSLEDARASRRPYRDVGFLVVWILQLVVVSSVAVFSGMECLSSSCIPTFVHYPKGVKPHPLLAPIMTSSAVAIFLCCLQMVLIQKFSRAILKCLMYTTVLVQAVIAFWTMGTSVAGGLVILGLACVQAIYFYFIRNRINFAAAHLEAGCTAIRAHPSTVCVAFGSYLVQLFWITIWAIAFFGIRTQSVGSLGTLMEVMMVWSLLWTLEVIQGTVHCATCGVVGEWWHTPKARKGGRSPTLLSLRQACSTSLGSICFGSLLVSALTLLRFVLTSIRNSLRRKNRAAACAVGCIEWIVRQVERAVAYFNSYAFTIVSIHGKDFITSGKEVSALFQERGWSALVNDNLADRVLALSCVGIACVTGLVGGGVAASEADNSSTSIRSSALLSFVVGLWMARTVTGVLTSSVRTIFVCFARAPTALANNHPAIFMKMCEAWQESHLAIFQRCGYREIFSAKVADNV